jgi:ribosome-binding protein aMBF1 (putative translation factor)
LRAFAQFLERCASFRVAMVKTGNRELALDRCHAAEGRKTIAGRQCKETKMKRPTIAAATLAVVVSFPCAAFADPHPLQQRLQRQLDMANTKQEAAERAKGSERQKLISEHMEMIQQAMQQMQAAKPQAGMSMQEYEEWITEHQKLMDEVLQQMIKDHELLMQEMTAH